MQIQNDTEIVNANHPPKTIKVPEELLRDAAGVIWTLRNEAAMTPRIDRSSSEIAQRLEALLNEFPWHCNNCGKGYKEPELLGMPYVCAECGVALTKPQTCGE